MSPSYRRSWCRRQRALIDLGGMIFGGSEKSGSMRMPTRQRVRKGGIDAITLSNLSEFCDIVRRKFLALEEVSIVGERMENRVLDGDTDNRKEYPWGRSFDEGFRERWSDDGSINSNGNGTMITRERRLSFESKIERAVSQLEEEIGWSAPRWRYSGREALVFEV